jgi:hypothetical protein
VKLVEGQADLNSVATDGAAVFFTSAVDGSLYRCAAAGCGKSATLIGAGNERSYFLALEGADVYWNNNSTNKQTTPGQVLGCPKAGCMAPEIITSAPMISAANPTQMGADAENIYWSSNAGTIWRASRKGDRAPVALTKITNSAYLAIRSGTVYISSASDNAVFVCPTAGCATPPPRLVAGDQAKASDITMDGVSVFWMRTGAIVSHAIGGNTATEIAPAAGGGRVAVEGGDLFWTEPSTGKVFTMPKTGGVPPRLLATDQTSVAGIAADTKFVYWVNRSEGAIYKLAR